MTLLWFALKSHPYKEDLLKHQAETHGFEVFYPRIRVQPVNPRSRRIHPYFPGYLFVHIDLEESGTSIFQWMPYASGLVSFGGEPSAVPDALIVAIRKRVGEIAEAGGELFDHLKAGDPVLIQGGPFEGYGAVFDTRISGSERVRVLLKILNNQSVRVELPAGQIIRQQVKPKQKS
ncbi:MAG TPA: transcription termination/antitermination NusG family protein [Anaerolineaceae bacterium]|jgi:transcription antitermination factor NusG